MKGVVSVTQGRLRGVWRGDLWSFSGIPYGRAPTGALRWRPPLEAESWSEIRDASTFGPIAPQSASVPGVTSPADPAASEPHSEDCLSLNIWTPALPESPTEAPGQGRPVMVFIHGGGFTSGSGSVFLYRGGELVRNGDAVVVTINYRLGALGFLGHRDLADPDGLVGNWGLQDQLSALRWVRDNIAAFGGDPGAVTIFGESAGGFSVAALLGTPAAKSLFRRAIVQSGGVHVHALHDAERSAERLASVLGIASCTRELLERVPATELVAATEELGKRRPDPGMMPLPFLPVVDGVLLPEHPLAAVADGAAAPDSPLSTSVEAASILVVLEDGLDSPAVIPPTFAGLAPGFAGLNQVNFTLPTSGLSDGDVSIAFNTVEALNNMATISVSGYSQSAARVAPIQRSSRLPGRAVPGRAAFRKHSKKSRRALPERSAERF